MVKQRSFTAPSGRIFRSQAHYKRSLRGTFANLNQAQRKNFKTQTYFTTRKEKTKILGNKKNIKQAEIETVKVTTLKSVKEDGKYKLKEKNEVARVANITKEDDDGNITEIVESEESSRYTPSKVQYEVESLDDSVVQVNASKDGRIVKSTTITTIPSETERVRQTDLEDRFLEFYRTSPKKRANLDPKIELSVREKVDLAKRLGGIPTGAPTHRKLTPKIKKRFEEQGAKF